MTSQPEPWEGSLKILTGLVEALALEVLKVSSLPFLPLPQVILFCRRRRTEGAGVRIC